MLRFTVNADRCKRCARCVQDCPARIIRMADGGPPAVVPQDEEACLRCQHCLAVCPQGAISVFGKIPDRSLPLTPEELPSLPQMTRLVRGRRSFRHYRDENVDRALLDGLLATLANVPTGVNRQELTFRVVDDREVMRGLRERIYCAILAAVATGGLPADGALERFGRTYYDTGQDILLRGAPHALLVSAPPDAPCPREDVTLALAYFELLAQSAGLGTVWCGLLKMALEALPALKPLFELPIDHAYYPMLFGVPSLRYARTVQRDEGAVVRRIRPN
ncbi:MAG: nitroreductase family protein [Candidatus Latescibacterota bacterium]